ncbi:MAG: hypothetical protein JWO81_1891 [Alphaproteobacteria bacterium]|nr:hypothetical protein [Alphaproteobacteria bacterium]
MLFAVTGILKPGAEAKLAGLQEAFNEHLAQPFRRIRLAGALRSADRSRTGFMVLLEADRFDQAEAYLRESPIFRADLYERVDVAEYELQVGRLD